MLGRATRHASIVDRLKPARRAEQAILRSSKHHFELCLTRENVSRRLAPWWPLGAVGEWRDAYKACPGDERFSFRNPLYRCGVRHGYVYRDCQRPHPGECRWAASSGRGLGGANLIARNLTARSADRRDPGTVDRCEPHRGYQVVRSRLCRLPRCRRRENKRDCGGTLPARPAVGASWRRRRSARRYLLEAQARNSIYRDAGIRRAIKRSSTLATIALPAPYGSAPGCTREGVARPSFSAIACRATFRRRNEALHLRPRVSAQQAPPRRSRRHRASRAPRR